MSSQKLFDVALWYKVQSLTKTDGLNLGVLDFVLLVELEGVIDIGLFLGVDVLIIFEFLFLSHV